MVIWPWAFGSGMLEIPFARIHESYVKVRLTADFGADLGVEVLLPHAERSRPATTSELTTIDALQRALRTCRDDCDSGMIVLIGAFSMFDLLLTNTVCKTRVASLCPNSPITDYLDHSRPR